MKVADSLQFLQKGERPPGGGDADFHHAGATDHDDGHVLGDGHVGVSSHDDDHILGESHAGDTAHDDDHMMTLAGHDGAATHDDGHILGDGHDGTTAHDDAHIVGDGHDGATAHNDAHQPWPTSFDAVPSTGELRVWMADPILVTDALVGAEDQIVAVWIWFDWGWALYSPLLPEDSQFDFLLLPGSVIFVVGA